MTMRDTFLPFSSPAIGEDEIDEVLDTLRSNWITTGPKVAAFEEDFRAYVGAPAALALSSGTAAMHVALTAFGIGQDDEVLTSALAFCSGVHVIEQVGAKPVLVDVDATTLNIDPAAVERVVGGDARPRALLPVHYGGHPCDMDRLMDLSVAHDLMLIEDAAHALPARYGERPIGDVSGDVRRAVCFSFYATKNLTTAEGGMLTGDRELIEEARLWSLHGMNRDAWKRYESHGSWFYEVVRAGFKYNMSDLQGALGLAQLRRLPAMHARRAEVARRYDEALSGLEEVQVPAHRPGIQHAWHLYALRLNLEQLDIDRDRFIDELKARNIGTSVHFIPVHLHPYYRDRYRFSPEDFPVAYNEYLRLVSLPLHPGLSDEDVDDVIEAVSDIAEQHRR